MESCDESAAGAGHAALPPERAMAAWLGDRLEATPFRTRNRIAAAIGICKIALTHLVGGLGYGDLRCTKESALPHAPPGSGSAGWHSQARHGRTATTANLIRGLERDLRGRPSASAMTTTLARERSASVCRYIAEPPENTSTPASAVFTASQKCIPAW